MAEHRMQANNVCPSWSFLEIGLLFPSTHRSLNQYRAFFIKMEEKAHENLLASVLGYTNLSKDDQCASKERGEESSIKPPNDILCIFNLFLQGRHGKCPLHFTSRIEFFHLIRMGFCSDRSKELTYLHQLTENPQKGRQCLSN